MRTYPCQCNPVRRSRKTTAGRFATAIGGLADLASHGLSLGSAQVAGWGNLRALATLILDAAFFRHAHEDVEGRALLGIAGGSDAKTEGERCPHTQRGELVA